MGNRTVTPLKIQSINRRGTVTLLGKYHHPAVSIDLLTLWKKLGFGGSDGGHPRPRAEGVLQQFSPPCVRSSWLNRYLAALRLLKAVREHDIELIRKYLGTRLGFASKLLGIVLVEVAGASSNGYEVNVLSPTATTTSQSE